MSTTGTSAIVIGGGIVGLAVANELTTVGHHVRVLEKEAAVAAHQTGRNSGVIHSGLYYKPGSLKARLCVAGTASMTEFAAEHHIAHDVPGKLVVASETAKSRPCENSNEGRAPTVCRPPGSPPSRPATSNPT